MDIINRYCFSLLRPLKHNLEPRLCAFARPAYAVTDGRETISCLILRSAQGGHDKYIFGMIRKFNKI